MGFWDTRGEIWNKEDRRRAKSRTKLHSEVLDHCGEVHNFASLLRCSCLFYRSRAATVLPDFADGAPPRRFVCLGLLMAAVERRLGFYEFQMRD